MRFSPLRSACFLLSFHLAAALEKRRSRSLYSSPDGNTALICAVSLLKNPWYGFDEKHRAHLARGSKGHVALCSKQFILLIPADIFRSWLDKIRPKPRDNRWHMHIRKERDKFVLEEIKKDVSQYLLPD